MEAEPDAAQGWPEGEGHGRNAEGGPGTQQDLLGGGRCEPRLAAVGAGPQAIRDERRDDDQVVQDRREHDHAETAVGLQQADGNGADPVEDDLRQEEAQEERADLLHIVAGSRIGDARRVQAHDRGREEDADGGQGTQHRHREG